MLALLINVEKQLYLTYMLHAAMEILLVTLFTNSKWHSLVVMFSRDSPFAILKSLSYSVGIVGAGSTEFHVLMDLLVPSNKTQTPPEAATYLLLQTASSLWSYQAH
jgi:hypothetical protein